MKYTNSLLILAFVSLFYGNAWAASCPTHQVGSESATEAVAINFTYYVAENGSRFIPLSATSPEIEYDNVANGWHTRYTADRWGSTGAIATWTLDTVPTNGTLYEGSTALAEGDTVSDPTQLKYVPATDTTGTESFTYCVTDTQTPTPAISETATVTLIVEARDSITMPYGIPTNTLGFELTPPADPGNWPSAEAAGFYYIDNNHVSCTDSQDYGYPDQPLCSWKYNADVNAGGKIVIASGAEAYIRSSLSWDRAYLDGTAGNYAWIVGEENAAVRPKITTSPSDTDGGSLRLTSTNGYWAITGVTFDEVGLDVRGNNENSAVMFSEFNNSQGTTGSMLDVNCDTEPEHTCDGTEDEFLVWHVGGFDNGIIDATLTDERDVHFINGTNVKKFWMLDVIAFGNAGDALQLGNNNSTADVYVGRMVSGTNMENCIDIKNFNNLIISESDCYDLRTVSYSGGSGGGAQNFYINDENAQAGYAYFLNNRAWDSNGPMFAANSIDSSKTYFIGNRGFHAPSGECMNSGQGGAERHYYFNTCYNVNYGINTYTTTAGRYFVGNVIHTATYGGRATGSDSLIDQWDYNTYIGVTSGYVIGTNAAPQTVDYATWQADGSGRDTNSQVNVTPNFVDLSQYDFRIQSGSDLIDVLSLSNAATVAPGLADLNTDLGVTWKDFNGTIRGTSAYDAGADELGGESSSARPSAPVLNSVTEI